MLDDPGSSKQSFFSILSKGKTKTRQKHVQSRRVNQKFMVAEAIGLIRKSECLGM